MKGLRLLKMTLLVIVLVVLIPPVALILFLWATEYRPNPVEAIPVPAKGPVMPDTTRTLTFLTWNIGYGGLGSGMDFFYDGGHRVTPPPDVVDADLRGIQDWLSLQDSTDFIFIQEIDTRSKRSYRVNQVDSISAALPGHLPFFARNYDCRYIPVPLRDPMGEVRSGIATFSRYRPDSVERYAYDAVFPFPKRLVFLKRCFMALHFPLANGRELVVVNLHNSTFDEGGTLRLRELRQLASFLAGEYRKGHYVICGGDWNMNPRGFDPSTFSTGDMGKQILPPFPVDFIPGWQFIFDPGGPSNRDVDTAYRKGHNPTTIIDFFVLSPNVEALSIHTIPAAFEWSDHNPVKAVFKLRPGL